MLGYEMQYENLTKELDFIREQINMMDSKIEEMQKMPEEEQRSDDWENLYFGYGRIRKELRSLLQHDYDAVSVTIPVKW